MFKGQYSLFEIRTVGRKLLSKLKKSSNFLALKLHAGKVTLKKKRIQERAYTRIKPYGDKPLFYGLPNMKQWLEWEKKNGTRSE